MSTENQTQEVAATTYDQNKVARINNVLSQYLGIAPEEIKVESHLEDDLGADSLDAVEIVMGLEDEFEREIPDEDAESWKTVKQIYDYLAKL
jgi:acyl carrier protein